MSGLIGLLRTVAPTYFWYAVFEFLEAMCASGIFTCSFALGKPVPYIYIYIYSLVM